MSYKYLFFSPLFSFFSLYLRDHNINASFPVSELFTVMHLTSGLSLVFVQKEMELPYAQKELYFMCRLLQIENALIIWMDSVDVPFKVCSVWTQYFKLSEPLWCNQEEVKKDLSRLAECLWVERFYWISLKGNWKGFDDWRIKLVLQREYSDATVLQTLLNFPHLL